jgi:hypothetical protein
LAERVRKHRGEQFGVFGDVLANRCRRLSRDLFDVIGGSVVASSPV